MSEPKRYRLDPESYLAEHPQGDFVDYQDYAALKAEVERLIKAGDLLGSALILFELKSEEERQERLENWAIAKYGKLHD